MTAAQFAVALAFAGLAAFMLVGVWWRATHALKRPIPPWATFALIGGWLALLGAVCFAVAFFLGG